MRRQASNAQPGRREARRESRAGLRAAVGHIAIGSILPRGSHGFLFLARLNQGIIRPRELAVRHQHRCHQSEQKSVRLKLALRPTF